MAKFVESAALSRLQEDFDNLLQAMKEGPAQSTPTQPLHIDTSRKTHRRVQSAEIVMVSPIDNHPTPVAHQHHLTFFETLYRDFTTELKQIAELDKLLKESESRLKSRDMYLQNTIIETAKKVHMLEQTVADLQNEKEDLMNDIVNLQHSQQPMSPPLRQPSTSSFKIPQKSPSHLTQAEIDEEREVERWIMSANRSPVSPPLKPKSSDKDLADTEALLELTQTLTSLAEEKELLESDLTIVRLQVEHLEAISKERDLVLQQLIAKRKQVPISKSTKV